METRTTFAYRLYPSKAQERRLDATLETARRFYNDLLAERKTAYEERRETVGKTAQLRRVKERKASNPYAAGVHSLLLQVVVTDLDRAFQAFFRRLQAGEAPGYPRFKGRDRFRSVGLKEYGNGFKVDGRRLKVHGIGRLAVRWHRPLLGRVKTLRLTRKAGKWYATFSCVVEAQPLPPTGQVVGVDVGLHHLLATSDGRTVAHPHHYREGQRRLRVLQRTVARREKGGASRREAVRHLQRHHEHVTNQRRDFLNKVARRLLADYDLIALEALRLPNLVRNRHLSKSILDAGWGYLAQHLTSKAASAGRAVCLVDPAYTSQECSGCGHRFQGLTLKDRWVSCAVCGLSLDRDHNAARNILRRAGHARLDATEAVAPVSREAVGL
jgi:putative transposase